MVKNQPLSIQEFARQRFNLELTPYQLDLIIAWAEGKTVVSARSAGLTTAWKVVRAYVRESLYE